MATVAVGPLALLAAGGNVFSDPHTTVDIYNGETGQWSTATLAQGGRTVAGAAIGSIALFAGGTIPTAPTSLVDIVDLSSVQGG
jgi:hypothetical protein